MPEEAYESVFNLFLQKLNAITFDQGCLSKRVSKNFKYLEAYKKSQGCFRIVRGSLVGLCGRFRRFHGISRGVVCGFGRCQGRLRTFQGASRGLLKGISVLFPRYSDDLRWSKGLLWRPRESLNNLKNVSVCFRGFSEAFEGIQESFKASLGA